MARLHEFQGKALLAKGGIPVPRGHPATTPAEARAAAATLAGPCVVKIQAWTTGRAAIGGIVFVNSPAEAEQAAARLIAADRRITVDDYAVFRHPDLGIDGCFVELDMPLLTPQ